MKKYYLPVNELALPSPRVGSIDTYSGFGAGSKRAIKIHQEIQFKLQKEHSCYEAEVPVIHTFTIKRMQFQISGRMDGIYNEEPQTIEEIKTAFDPKKLIASLKDQYFTHPYWLQLQMYGYIHWLKTNKVPQLNLLIVSLRNKNETSLSLDFDIESFEEWLDKRLLELSLEVKESTQRIKRRCKEGGRLLFPFDKPRPNQKELMEAVEKGMSKKRPMLLQAPTGLGKTTGILFPVLKESLGRGQKTIYITPKNSQHQIAVDSVLKLQAKGSKFKSVVLTSKKKICMKNEPLCNVIYCEFAEDHHTKVTANQLLAKIKKQKNLDGSYFKKMASTYKVCPYELQMDSISHVDVVIGDYNYVFSPHTSAQRVAALHFSEQEKSNLVIDEVHNVIGRSIDYYSPSLHIGYFQQILNNVAQFQKTIQEKLTQSLKACITLVQECATPGIYQPHRVEISINRFKEHEGILNELMSDYLESEALIESGDPILNLYNYWSDFVSALELVEGNDAFFTSFNTQHPSIKITCCDASSFLKESYDSFKQIIGFSATLKPFDYYSQLMGLPTKIQTQEFSSPFPLAHRKLLIIPQLSTKYSDRVRSYAKLIEAITRIASLKLGNYFIFFPSFDYLEKIVQQFEPPAGFVFMKQERGMGAYEVTNLLQRLHSTNVNHLFFAVQGGMFAEGIDYLGDLAIGAFIVGPPLPMYDWEREQMKLYYDTKYNAGTEYAYIYPAMAKAIQAAGRVIRSETDSGLIVLFDNRFLHSTYNQCMPEDWFEDTPEELISRSILKDVQEFWDSITSIDAVEDGKEKPFPSLIHCD
jgi:DNA excision repair protein ERCC-2